MTQTIPFGLAFPSLASALAALTFMLILLAKNRSNAWTRSVTAVLGTVAITQLGGTLALVDPGRAPVMHRVGMMGELLLPVTLLYAGLALTWPGRGGEDGARWRARAVLLLSASLCGLIWMDPVFAREGGQGSVVFIALGPLSRVSYFFIVMTLAIGLAQLEQILRATREPLRYQLKFVLIGLGALAGYEIYQASALLMLPSWRSDRAPAGGIATLVSMGVIAYGFGRSRLREVTAKVYISPHVLYGSITFIVVGLYLLGVGLLGELMRYADVPLNLGLGSLVVFLASIGLVVGLFSRTTRAELRRFVARHFYRSKYDYRTKWIEVTDAFRTTDSVEAILDQLLHLLSRTFGAARISIWIRYQADGHFHEVRSVNAEPPPRPVDTGHPVVQRLTTTDEPVELARAMPGDDQSDPYRGDPFLTGTRAALFVPIRSQGSLIAFVTMSSELRGEAYGTDDRDLLRAIAHHVGVVLSHVWLAEERRSSAELEALHRFSAFCLHDLKNLTARLSLVVQNAAVHGRDPGFQDVALRTVATTVEKMMALITKLSGKAIHAGSAEPVDVQSVIDETIGSVAGGPFAKVRATSERLPPVSIVRDQLHQTLLNLILNAQQAAGEGGEVLVTAARQGESVVITVSDTGPGIPADRLQTLFQPFRTTTPGGLGIGLFQCKQIVEAHHGSIWVDSEMGRGTRVRIELPIANERETCVTS